MWKAKGARHRANGKAHGAEGIECGRQMTEVRGQKESKAEINGNGHEVSISFDL